MTMVPTALAPSEELDLVAVRWGLLGKSVWALN